MGKEMVLTPEELAENELLNSELYNTTLIDGHGAHPSSALYSFAESLENSGL